MKNKVNIEVFYPHSPERVWAALTESDSLGCWLMPTTFKPILGLRFRFDAFKRGSSDSVNGVVLEVQPGKKLVYTWEDGEDDAPGVVSWTLHPKDGGTHLRLEHVRAEEDRPVVLIEASANWRYALHSALPAILCRRKPMTPIVYVEEDLNTETEPKRRAGFRQEEAPCC